MANLRWESGAAPVAQVNTYLFAGTWEADDLTRITCGNKIKDVAAGGVTGTIAAAAVDTAIDALSSDDFPEIVGDLTGVTASAASGTLTLTANEPGVPFTITLTPLEANGSAADAQTIEGAGTATSGTASVVNSGPFVWSTAANWSTGAVPVDSDNIYIDHTSAPILFGLNQSSIQPASMTIWQSFTGVIGLSKTNTAGTAYPEYLDDYLSIGPTTLQIGQGEGAGSGRIKINTGSDQTAITVFNTGSPLEPDLGAFLWKGTHISNTMTVLGNSIVGVAVYGDESATLATLTVHGNGIVRCGVGTTLTTVTISGSPSVYVNSNIGGTLTMHSGQIEINGTATVAQLTLRGGRCVYNSTGTVSGNTVLAGDAVLDLSQAPGAVTFTNPIELYGRNCRIIDPFKRIASLIVDFNEGAAVDQVEWGSNLRLTRAAVA